MAKAKGRGRAVGAKANGRARAVGVKAKAVAVPEPEPEEEGRSSSRKRRLGRRDSDDQVERFMEQKLYGKSPREIIEGAFAEDGTTPRSMITKEVQANTGDNEYLKASFWTRFFLKLPLQKGLAALLPDPPDGEDVAPEVLEALAPLHDKNPVARTASNLLVLLGATIELNETELQGIIVGCQMSVLVTEAMYKQVMMALMRYCEKYKAAEKFPTLLKVVLPVFAHLLMQNFDERMKLPASNWIRQNISRLQLFMESGPLLNCALALQNQTQPPVDDLRLVLGTTMGNHLIQCFMESMVVTDVMKTVNDRLDDLETLDFAAADVAYYNEVMTRELIVVKAAGIGNNIVIKKLVPFMATLVKAKMAGPNGVVQKCLASRVKTIALHSGQCRLLPCEVLCFSDGLLENMHNVPDAALTLLGSEPLTLLDMKKIITNNSKELLDCDEHFDLELPLLHEKVEALPLQKMREAVLAPSPWKQAVQTMPNEIAAFEKLLRGPLCFASGADAQGQVKGLLTVVTRLSSDEPPAMDLHLNASDFYRQAMARMLNISSVRVDTPAAGKGPKSKSSTVVLFGRIPLDSEIRRLQHKAATKQAIDSKDVKLLKTYRYALTTPEAQQVDVWQQQAIQGALIMYKRIQDKAESLEHPSDTTIVLASSRSSSSSALVLKSPLLMKTGLKPKIPSAKGCTSDTTKELVIFFARKNTA
jgi:hypothetical protein